MTADTVAYCSPDKMPVKPDSGETALSIDSRTSRSCQVGTRWASGFSGMEWWTGMVEWTGMVDWNGMVEWTGMEWWNGTVLW